MLEVRDLRAWYGRTQALFGVDLELSTGECLALVGTNGAGKTTIIRAILGLIRTTGAIVVEGRSVERLATARRVREQALARAIVERPRLLLLDEPSLGLAPGIVDEIYGHLGRLREAGLTMLLVEQSIARARDFADGLCLIRAGRSIEKVLASDRQRVADLVQLTFNQTKSESGAQAPRAAEV
jgi:ABC-type branched-subunit amino acid transport system ATPase component